MSCCQSHEMVLGACRLAKPAMGISPWQMRQLYQVVAIPSFTYAADVWFALILRCAGGGKARGAVGAARWLTSVQRIATMAVTGVLCTTASDSMELHTNLLPIELLMHKICHRAALCLVALPEPHPVYKLIQHCAHRDVK